MGLWTFYFFEALVAGKRRTWEDYNPFTQEHTTFGSRDHVLTSPTGWPRSAPFEPSLIYGSLGLHDALSYASARLDEWVLRHNFAWDQTDGEPDTHRYESFAALSYVGDEVWQTTQKHIAKTYVEGGVRKYKMSDLGY